MDQIERTARLIRSKGVGVYFVTQAPTDVPSSVLAQLGNRVQHALRAFTPDDADALRKTARTFPMTDYYDVERTITSLGHRRGARHGAVAARASRRRSRRPASLPPDSLMAPLRPRPDRRGRIAASPLATPSTARRSTARAPTRSSRAGSRAAPRGRGGRRRRSAAGVDADDRRRPGHDDAGPAAARDRPPGARARGRPARRRARAQGRRRRARARRPQRRASRPIDDGDPDRRQGRHVAGRPGHDPRRLRDAVRRRAGSR